MAYRLSTVFDSDGDNSAQAGSTTSCQLHYLHVINTNVNAAYLQLFNAVAGDVTVGTTTPKMSLFIPANGAHDAYWGDSPIDFDTALTYACSTTATGNGDPSTGLVINLGIRG